MSILGDNASCSAGANPLAQMNKYMSADRSLQREQHTGVHGPSSSLRGGEYRQLNQQDHQLYQSMQRGGRPDAFRFDEFRKEMPVFDNQSDSVSRHDRGWSAEFAANHQPGNMGPQANNNWASEFSRNGSPSVSQMANSGAGPGSQNYMPSMSTNPMGISSFGMDRSYGMSNFPVAAQQHQQQHQQPVQATKEDAAKWEEVFQNIERHTSPQTDVTADAAAKSENISEGAVDQTAAAQEAEAEAETEDTLDTLENREEIAEDIFGNTYPPNWDEMWDNINDNASATANVRTEDFRAASGTYEFAKENEFADEEDPFALGVYMMDNGAKLSCAALCFEEAVRRDPSHVEAWARLGDAQAQNEVEEPAIVALEKAVSLNPRHDRALLNLAISYTNEGYDAAASQILEKWIAAKYPDISEVIPADPSPTREQLHARVTKMFLTAAQRTPTHGLDPDVQVGLGVLCYRDDDYEKAIDCFRSALSVRPNDASLWNRLGATLANASHPEEAIDAYYKALELRPSFVRARYNLAVSCINIGCYREAAENILSAISLHDTEDGDAIDFNRSANLIDTLRRVFFALDRRDLLSKLTPGSTLRDFRGEFKF